MVAPSGTGNFVPSLSREERDLKHLCEVSGHFRVERKRAGWVWYAKYRLPDGRQCRRKIGLAWTSRGGREPAYDGKLIGIEVLAPRAVLRDSTLRNAE